MKRILYPRFVDVGLAHGRRAARGGRARRRLRAPVDHHGHIVWPAADLVAELRAWCERALEPSVVSRAVRRSEPPVCWSTTPRFACRADDARTPPGPAHRPRHRGRGLVAHSHSAAALDAARFALCSPRPINPNDTPRIRPQLALLLHALAAGEIRLGRGRSAASEACGSNTGRRRKSGIESADALLDLLGSAAAATASSRWRSSARPRRKRRPGRLASSRSTCTGCKPAPCSRNPTAPASASTSPPPAPPSNAAPRSCSPALSVRARCGRRPRRSCARSSTEPATRPSAGRSSARLAKTARPRGALEIADVMSRAHAVERPVGVN